MTSATLTVWCNLPLPELSRVALVGGLGVHRLVQASEIPPFNQPLGRPDAGLLAADIVFGQPEAEQCVESKRLLWVQLSSAGHATFANTDVRAALVTRGIPVSTSSAVYDEPCAQHALGFMLAEARQFPHSLGDQLATHAWDTVRTRAGSFLLKGQTVLLVGYGAIATRLAQLLAPFDMKVVGFRRRPRGDEIIQVHPISELASWLPRADFVIDILPAMTETTEFFDEAAFAAMKPGAIFINIGRGTTVDQAALLAALRNDLRAAYLDVTVPEPLPPDDALWTQPNCFITPHVAGGHHDEYQRLVAHFLTNVERFLRGQTLVNRVY
jgi:phosphoglycerate dehydrogenase-like enzyme